MPASRRMTLGVLMLAVAAALVVFAIVLSDSQSSARDDLEGRFRERATASAALGASLFETASRTAQMANARRYGRVRISQDALERRAQDGGNRYLVVLDAEGRILARTSGANVRVRRMIASQPSFISRALRGQDYALSNVQGSATQPELVYTQAFDTDLGRRALVTGLDARTIAEFLAGSLRRLPSVEGGRQYVLDAGGAIIATGWSTQGMIGDPVGEPGLIDVVREERQDGVLPGERYFVSRPIEGTPWRVVRTAPEDELFASVQGINTWGPWLLFCGFGLAAFSAVGLVGSVLRKSARIDATNAQLWERASQLATANAQLEWANTELGRSNAELERFASIASHDLQEPLRKVQMFAERIEHHEAAELSERSRDYLERMSSAAHRMQDLIESLLVYSRVTMKPGPVAEVDLGTVAREVLGDLQVTVREVGGEVHVGDLPSVPADALQMRQLLQNLVANALKFRRDGIAPVVRIDGRVDGGFAVVTVTDNGIGVEERHVERIFNVFERLHARTAYPGTGIGLALCRRIVERHGGTIAVQSTPGVGSAFSVSLPLQSHDRRRPPSGPDGADRKEARLART